MKPALPGPPPTDGVLENHGILKPQDMLEQSQAFGKRQAHILLSNNPTHADVEDTCGLLQDSPPAKARWEDPSNGKPQPSTRTLPGFQRDKAGGRTRRSSMWDTHNQSKLWAHRLPSPKIQPKETHPTCNANKHRKYRLLGYLRLIFYINSF